MRESTARTPARTRGVRAPAVRKAHARASARARARATAPAPEEEAGRSAAARAHALRVTRAHVARDPCTRRAAVPRSACGRAVSRTGAGAAVPHDAGHGANPPYTRMHARTYVERKPRAGSRARAGSAPEVVRRKPRAESCAPEAVHRKPRTGSRAPIVYFF